MLLFIKYYTRLEYHRFVFQYITCYSLSANIYRGVPEWLEFQYITCYSLSDCGRIASVYHLVSIHHMLLFIHGSNSTSCLIWWFQYITCYSLSVIANMTVNQIHLFQYITCYSLSLYSPFVRFSEIGFNTSHVTLYHGGRDRWQSEKWCFNTSHVTLYRFTEHFWEKKK